MLEIQKDRIYQRSRLRAKGASDDEIKQAQHLPFKPAFVEGKRRKRHSTGHAEECEVPTGQFSFRKER